MAWDKVTKIDSIAKRKPYSKVNAGMLVEYVSAYNRADTKSYANFKCPNSARQDSLIMTRSGKFRRVTHVPCDGLLSNTPTVG